MLRVASHPAAAQDIEMPVFFATELIAAALSGSYPTKQQKLHLVSPDVLTRAIDGASIGKEGSA